MATPQSIRYLNKINALEALFRSNGKSRADLARQLGLDRASIGFIVQDLLAENLVIELPEIADPNGAKRAGRPSILVRLNPSGAVFLGAEIGVDHITCVVCSLACEIKAEATIAWDAPKRTPDETLTRAKRLLSDLLKRPETGQVGIRGVCVAVPGIVRDGVVVHALMLNWSDVALGRLAQSIFGSEVPVTVENDANALSFGAIYSNQPMPNEAVACLNIENGVGGGITIGGKLFRGSHGFSGEFGQINIGGDGWASGACKPGHLESYIGKDAILARYRAHRGPRKHSFDDFLCALEKGKTAAVSAARDWAEKLAQGLCGIIQVLNPSRIYLSGSVSTIYQYVEQIVLEQISRELLRGFPCPDIQVLAQNRIATAFGAACIVHQGMFTVNEADLHQFADGTQRARATNSKSRIQAQLDGGDQPAGLSRPPIVAHRLYRHAADTALSPVGDSDGHVK